jgi:hypothetical protein
MITPPVILEKINDQQQSRTDSIPETVFYTYESTSNPIKAS